MTDIQVEVRRQFDDLPREARLAVVHEHQVDVGGAAEHRIRLADERTGQVHGDDGAVVVDPLLRGFLGNADQRLPRDAHGAYLLSGRLG